MPDHMVRSLHFMPDTFNAHAQTRKSTPIITYDWHLLLLLVGSTHFFFAVLQSQCNDTCIFAEI